MHSVLFTVGGLRIHSYGFMIDIGIICAYFLMAFICSGYKIKKEYILDIVILMTVCGMAGTRIMYIILNRNEFPDIKSMLEIWNGGQSFHGGLIAGIICLAVWCKIKKQRLPNVLDLLSPALALAYGFGRIGCFLNGCCGGRASASFLSVPMPTEHGIESCIPTQLFSSAAGFLICGLLLLLRKYNQKEGVSFAAFMGSYGIYRFVIEFFRYYPAEKTAFCLTQGQIVSIAMIIFSATLIFAINKKTDSP